MFADCLTCSGQKGWKRNNCMEIYGKSKQTMTIKIGLFALLLVEQFWVVTSCIAQVPEIPDLGRRGSSYIVSSSEPYLKDSTLRSGWYRANDGSRIYTILNGSAPDIVHCGTFYPVYVRDHVPSQLLNGIEYNFTACLVQFDSNCTLQYDIKIRNCDGEIQFYLVPTDGESAYCFEPQATVVPAPNYSIAGDIVVSVALMYKSLDDRFEPELDFKCNFQASNLYYYDVSWAINGRVEKTFRAVKSDKLDETNLNEREILKLGFSLGFSVQCFIHISSHPFGNRTNPQPSDVFYAGIKTSLYTRKLYTGGKLNIDLWVTIPFGCKRHKLLPSTILEPCTFEIQMFNPNSDGYTCGTTVSILDDQKLCGVTLNGSRMSEGGVCVGRHNVNQCTYKNFANGMQKQYFTVVSSNDLLIINNDQKTVTLQTKAGKVVYHNVLANATGDNIQVLYQGNTEKNYWMNSSCHVRNDPYVQKFNYDQFYFDDVGFFLMYNNTKLHNDVQIKSQLCSVRSDSTATCACAVSVQAAGDIFMIDVCSDVLRASFLHCRGNVLNVRQIYSEMYEIYLPSGTFVQVTISTYNSPKFLKIYIYPSPSDVDSTEGICGNLTGEYVSVNTSAQRTVSKWRMKQSALNTPNYSLQSSFFPPIKVCTCPKINKATEGIDQNAFCYTNTYETCENRNTLPGERKDCKIRSKRSIRRHKRNIQRLIKLSTSTNLEHRRAKRSTDLVYTEEEAYEQCLKHFASKELYSIKEKLPDIPNNATLLGCVNDVMRDGHNEFWKQENFLSWSATVEMAIRRNKTYQDENVGVVHQIQNISCPFECHGNGNCTNGTCICWEDFDGDSCFVRRSNVLEMTDVEGGGFCDLKHGDDCHECLQFYTSNLLKGFKCKINAYDIDVTGSVIKQEDDIRTGEYENMFEGYCCPSAVSQRQKKSLKTETFVVQYSIAISNDGVHFGRTKDVYVHDSKCQEYSSTANGTIFTLKENTCFINGECFQNGESLVNEAMSTCCPSLNSYQWTPKEECSGASNTDSGNEMMTIIAAVCGSVGGALAIAICLCLVSWKVKANKRDVSVSTPHLNSNVSPYYINTAFDDAVFEAKPQKGSSNGNKHFSAKRSFFETEKPPVYSNLN